MAADASIYSLIRPPTQVAGPLDQYTEGLKVKSLMGQSDLQNLKIEDARREAAAGEKVRALFAGGTEPADAQVMAIDPKIGMAYAKSRLETQKTKADIGKTQAETIEKSLKIHRDQLANVNDPASAAQWVKAGFNDPALSPIMQRAGSPDEVIAKIPQDPQGFQQWKMQNGLGIEKFMEMTKPEFKPIGGEVRQMNPNAAGADVKAISAPITPTADAVMSDTRIRSEGAANRGVTMRGQNMTDARQREMNGILEDGSPVDISPTAKLIARGDMAMPTLTTTRPGAMARHAELTAAVMKENPNWTADIYPTVKKTVMDFSTGKQGQTVKALNTATDHLETLKELSDAVKNGNVQLFNRIANAYATNTGNPAPSNLATAAQIVGAEIVKGISGASGGVEDRNKAAGAFSNVKSPADVNGAIETVTKLMGGQFKGLKQQYEAGTHGRNDFAETYLTPAARAALERAQAPTKTTPAAPVGAAPVRISGDDGYNALPKGAAYIGPDGIARVK